MFCDEESARRFSTHPIFRKVIGSLTIFANSNKKMPIKHK